MKKQIIAGVTVTACVALCAAVWPRSAEVEGLPVEPAKAAVTAEIEARSAEIPQILLYADTPAPEAEAVAESEPPKTEITAEKETEQPVPTQTAHSAEAIASFSEPRNGDVRVANGEKQIYLLGFGWIKDEGGGSVGTTVGNPGDELTGNKVGIMRGTVGSDGDINKMVGIMGGDECPSSALSSAPVEQPEPTGDVIYAPIQPPVTKDSTPPPYKPNGEPYNP